MMFPHLTVVLVSLPCGLCCVFGGMCSVRGDKPVNGSFFFFFFFLVNLLPSSYYYY